MFGRLFLSCSSYSSSSSSSSAPSRIPELGRGLGEGFGTSEGDEGRGRRKETLSWPALVLRRPHRKGHSRMRQTVLAAP